MPTQPDGSWKFDDDVKKFLEDSRKERETRDYERDQHANTPVNPAGVQQPSSSGSASSAPSDGDSELLKINREMLLVLKEISLKVEGMGMIG